jgi:hypothetical protein
MKDDEFDYENLPWADEKKGAASIIWDLVAVIGIFISVLAITGVIGG